MMVVLSHYILGYSFKQQKLIDVTQTLYLGYNPDNNSNDRLALCLYEKQELYIAFLLFWTYS